MEYGGEEFCKHCSLDPNVQDYPAEEIAHLWKENHNEKSIREVMLRGLGQFRPGSNIGIFLRENCGPHCEAADECSQTTKDFSACYSVEKAATLNMGRKKKGKNKKKHRSPEEIAAREARKKEKREWRELHSRAWLFTPSEGWFVSTKNYEPDTINPGKPGT
jgi:hypothetical protein